VAFVSRLKDSDDPALRSPYLLGTGFVVNEKGIVATNRHVIEALEALPRDPSTSKRIGRAVLLQDGSDEAGGFIRFIPAEIRSVATIKVFVPGELWFGEDGGPDIGFVQINLCGIPAATLCEESLPFRAGTSVAIAGYPLGLAPVLLYGRLTCPQPLIRRGVISSVFPHRAPEPQGFTTDIMIQGGASGSPVFLCDRPVVLGIMHASLLDGEENTNISVAVSSIQVSEGLRTLFQQHKFSFDGAPSLADRLEAAPIIRIDGS
jgi:hypothetical protein